MTQFAVYRIEPAAKARSPIGAVALDKQHRLELVSASQDARADLDRAVADINGRRALIMHVLPLPEDPPFSLRKAQVERSDPAFPDAVRDNFKRWHNMDLVAE